MMAAAGKMVMQMTLAPGTEGAVKKMVMQLGAGDPMDMPVELSGSKPFTKPNPKTLVGSETIKVAAGSFKTKHYRDKTPQGDKIDFWVSESAPPLGLVKIELEQKNNPQIKGKLQFDLTGEGEGCEAAGHQAGEAVRSGGVDAADDGRVRRGCRGGRAPGRQAGRTAGAATAAACDEEVAARSGTPSHGLRTHRGADAEAPRGGAASG